MSKANQELLRGKSVTEVAYQYGYQSVDGFSRAFKKWSGMLPSEAAKLQKCKTFQKLSFVVAIKGGNMMEYKIIEKEAFCFAGVSKRVPMQFEGVNLEIVNWRRALQNSKERKCIESRILTHMKLLMYRMNPTQISLRKKVSSHI